MSVPGTDSGEQVAQYWGDAEFTRTLGEIHWMASAVVRRYLNRLASGSEAVDWLTHLAGRHLRERRHRVLVLGCGEGWLERAIARSSYVETIDAYDIASSAVARAAELAAAEGIENVRYGVLDLNRETLPLERYDLVIAHSVLHHVENLEHAFPQIAGALAPDGLLLVNEYVGPMRFQYTDIQMRVINDLLAKLPERYRRSAVTGGTYPEKTRPTIEEMIRTDPSEAVRSDELVPFLHAQFDVVESILYGGTILNHLLYDIVQNFSDNAEPDRTVMELLCLVEESLIAAAALDSDYQLIVARRKGSNAATAVPHPPPASVARPSTLSGLAARAGGALAGFRQSKRESDLRGLEHPVLRAHVDRGAGGGAEVSWNMRVREELAGRDDLRVLVLGERHHEWSRSLRGQPEVIGVDAALSRGSAGLAALSDDRYSLVVSIGALSMLQHPRRDLERIVRSMKRGGVLIGEEYVGLPLRQMEERTARAVDRLLAILPGTEPRELPRRLRTIGLQLMTGGAPHAAALPSLLLEMFSSCDVRPATSLLLQNVIAARPALIEDPAQKPLLELLCAFERWMIELGVIGADFVTIRCVKA